MRLKYEVRCIKDGYNITKGDIYEIKDLFNFSDDFNLEKYLNRQSGIKITDDKGGTRYYLTEYFIVADDKQTWRDLILEEYGI